MTAPHSHTSGLNRSCQGCASPVGIALRVASALAYLHDAQTA